MKSASLCATYIDTGPALDRDAPIQSGPLDAGLIALLDLRASQFNGCLLCVQYGLCLAFQLPWRHRRLSISEAGSADVFCSGEKAALAWTERLAGVNEQSASDEMWSRMRK